MKLIIDCNKIKTEKAIQLYNEVVELIEDEELDNYIKCEVKEK